MVGGDGTHQRTDHFSLAGATQGSQVPSAARGDAAQKLTRERERKEKRGTGNETELERLMQEKKRRKKGSAAI